MRRVIMQCDGCENQYGISASIGDGEWANLANGWFTLHENPRENSYKEDAHFCSAGCLKKFFGIRGQPQSTMRRFTMTDGETADKFDGVLFGSGHVAISIDPELAPVTVRSWEHFKETHEGCDVTWIDQEVSGE